MKTWHLAPWHWLTWHGRLGFPQGCDPLRLGRPVQAQPMQTAVFGRQPRWQPQPWPLGPLPLP